MISGILALFGVQLGIFDFIGRISKASLNITKYKGKFSENLIYKSSIIISAVLGILVLAIGFDQPKSLLVLSAILNAFSMGVIALLLLVVEYKVIRKQFSKSF